MKIHQLSVQAALESLQSSPGGLSESEARRRLREFGPNRLEQARPEPLWRRVGRELTHFFALILWFGAALAFVAELNDPGQGMAALAWAIVGVIVLNAAFSFWQEYRAERAVIALRRLLPRRVHVVRAGDTVDLEVEALVPGDIVMLSGGDSVPADCRLLESYALRVNSATLTGESHPSTRDAKPSAAEDLLSARNVLLAGTSLVSGEARALVFATGMRTEFGKIAHLTQSVRGGLSPLQREIARLSRLVAMLAVGIGVAFFILGLMIGLPFWLNFVFAIGIIVANVPEGLLPTVTLSLAMATQRMARRNALVRHMPAVEALGAATVICTDKTGTLTRNSMTAHRLFVNDAIVDAEHLNASVAAVQCLLDAALHCHTAVKLGDHGSAGWAGDPTEIALIALAERYLSDALKPRIDEIPFDPDRRRMSTVHQSGGHRILYCKGALETVLPSCIRIQRGTCIVPIDSAARERIVRAQEEMAEQGLRVMAFAYRQIQAPETEPRECDLTLLGLVGLEDPPRPEVPAAISQCREAGIRVIMVTGDHPQTARAVAARIGLLSGADPLIVTGDVLRQMSDVHLQLALDRPDIVFARVGADQKMRVVEALKRKGHIVAVTGDGVNDAPALRSAHIGIAMGLSGTDVAKEAADVVLLDDNFATIVAAIEEGRSVFENIRKFLTYILTSNVPELVPYLAFVLFKIPLPLTIAQILAVDLGTDILPALALGAEKPSPEIMRAPPRRHDERLLTRALLMRAYLFLGPLEAAAAMIAFFFVLWTAGWTYGVPLAADDPLYLRSTSACFAAIVVMQVVNVLLCRHPRRSLFSPTGGRNALIDIGIAVELLLLAAIIYTPWGQSVFGTAALEWDVWLVLLPLAGIMLGFEELRKLIVRRHVEA